MRADPVRLLVLTTSFPNQSNPASGVFVRRLLEHLPRTFHPTVVTPDTDRASAFDSDPKIRIKPFSYAPRKFQVLAHKPGGLPVVFRTQYGYWLLLPGFCLAAAVMMFREARKADLIHAQWAPSGVIAGLTGWLMRRPVITTLRGTDFSRGPDAVLLRWGIRCCLHLNKKVVTVSREMADLLSKWFPHLRHKVVFIPNGVAIPESETFATRRSAKFQVVVIGNLIPGKRVDVTLKAFDRLTRSVPHARLLVVGDGPERNGLETLAGRLGLEKKVTFLGSIDPEAVQQVLRSCHALVLASEHEGRPNVVLEAMAAGVPVVAADICSVRELIGLNERGLLFAPGDIAQLTSRLVLLKKDSATGFTLARKASDWLRGQGLTWRQTAAAYSAVYSQVLAEFRRGKAKCVA